MKEEADDGEQGKGSNRTFMELKQAMYRNINNQIKCSNRTFMELKFAAKQASVTLDVF